MASPSPPSGRVRLIALAAVVAVLAVAAGIYVGLDRDGNADRTAAVRPDYVPAPGDDAFATAIMGMTHAMWVQDYRDFGLVSFGEQERAGRCVVETLAALPEAARSEIGAIADPVKVAEALDRLVPAVQKDAVQACIETPTVAARTRLAVAATRPAVEADSTCAAAKETAGRLDPLARGELAAFRPSAAPVQLGDLAFRAPDGTPVTLADFGGRTTLVNLWATWCVPCRAEMPALDRLAKAEGGDRFMVLPINLDTAAGARPATFLTDIGAAALPLYADPDLKSLNALKRRGLILGGLPTTFLVDAEGCLLGLLEGPAEWDSPEAIALVRGAAGAPQAATAPPNAAAPARAD